MKLKLISKPKMHPSIEQPSFIKKQRTNRPRRNRPHVSPILFSEKAVENISASLSVNDDDDVSCDSSRITAESSLRKRKFCEDPPFRRITRSYYRQKESRNEVEVSESSCIQSGSGADKEIQVNEVSESVNKSEAKEFKENDAVSTASAVESCFSYKSVGETDHGELKLEVSSLPEQKPLGLECDLACTEHFPYDDVVSENSSSHESAFSELQSEIFLDSSSDLDFSDYTPSIFLESGSDFSEKSQADSPPSQTYSLLLEFRKQFFRSTDTTDTRRSSLVRAQGIENSIFVKFEDEEDEENYKRLRERERRQIFLHDYPESYHSSTEYGDLIYGQRLRMVHWIIEQATAKEFQQETMFLGVSLLDRFLSKGFFTNKRSLQIAGVACLTLATRIEENQPYNCVRQKKFYVGSKEYSRYEVVAMEWLVQEVLNFQCFLPTIYNFMWFYLKVAKADAALEKRAKYLAVLALSDHEQLAHWPSTVAAGLVMLASVENNQMGSYQRVIEVHVRTKENDLHDCIENMEWLIQYVN